MQKTNIATKGDILEFENKLAPLLMRFISSSMEVIITDLAKSKFWLRLGKECAYPFDPEPLKYQIQPLRFYFGDLDKKINRWKNRFSLV